eukprot:3933448-Alexandrium_andersonii.AAC.1
MCIRDSFAPARRLALALRARARAADLQDRPPIDVIAARASPIWEGAPAWTQKESASCFACMNITALSARVDD